MLDGNLLKEKEGDFNATLLYYLAREDLHNLLEKEYAPVKSA